MHTYVTYVSCQDVLGLNALLAAASRGTLWKGALGLTTFALEHRWQMDDFGCSLVLSAMNAVNYKLLACREWQTNMS